MAYDCKIINNCTLNPTKLLLWLTVFYVNLFTENQEKKIMTNYIPNEPSENRKPVKLLNKRNNSKRKITCLLS